MYLVLGGVPGPGECTWSWGVVPGPGGVPGMGGVPGLRYLVLGGCTWSGGVPGPRGCTWSLGGVSGLGDVPGPGGIWSMGWCTWSQGPGTPPCEQNHTRL